MSGEQRRGACFYRRKEKAERAVSEFSLAGLLLNKEKFFLPTAGNCKVSFLLEMLFIVTSIT